MQIASQEPDSLERAQPVETLDVAQESHKYPEGGKDAWLVVAGAWCAMIPSMGLLNTLAVLQAWVSQNELHGLPESTIGWVFSTYAFFLYFCGAQVGPIFDARDVRFLVIPGCVGVVASLMLMSLCKEFYQFLLTFGVLGGVSASLLFNPSIAAIGHWFSERRALATGIACTAGGVGGVVFPLIILYMAPKVGFPWAIRTVGFICAATSVLACTLLKKRLPPSKTSSGAIDLKALKETKFGLATLAVFLIEFAVFIPYTYICSYAIHEGIDLQKSLLLSALLNAGAIPGRALPGYVADRFGPFNVMCVTALVCSTFIFALWMTARGGEAATTAFAVMFGFWSGAAISLTPVCIGQVCRIEDYGKRSGTAFFVCSFGALVGVPFAGAILQWSGGTYDGLILFAGGLYILSFFAFAVARGVAGGWNPRILL
ncbi:major facilitator superfamily domain-containing protein [Colletotrichum phormii]|uniref:Major facilitator superfamily domain-containing protein n=1 Tax=Colletotrichum phormii TaxID=359342 RepID=A0AAI9ZVT8_9PEZI|nr:major facilitator superfamily domain-containing protein [Colletotrichum phormii]KAK1638760.1 major facilitator superfamily domain-containing protein [Colletotrichum phormii]